MTDFVTIDQGAKLVNEILKIKQFFKVLLQSVGQNKINVDQNVEQNNLLKKTVEELLVQRYSGGNKRINNNLQGVLKSSRRNKKKKQASMTKNGMVVLHNTGKVLRIMKQYKLPMSNDEVQKGVKRVFGKTIPTNSMGSILSCLTNQGALARVKTTRPGTWKYINCKK